MVGSRTKLVGYLMVAIAVLNTVVDLLNGSGFNLAAHMEDLKLAFTGAGFVFLRKAVENLKLL